MRGDVTGRMTAFQYLANRFIPKFGRISFITHTLLLGLILVGGMSVRAGEFQRLFESVRDGGVKPVQVVEIDNICM